MKRHILNFIIFLALMVVGVADDRLSEGSPENTSQSQVTETPNIPAVVDENATEQEKIPATLEEALDIMVEGLSEEDRKFIEDLGDEYSPFAHFGSGMWMRNSWGLWGDSPLTRYFARIGIYHADDMSAIINEAFSRRVRGKDIELDKLVQYCRDSWEKQDIVAPLDLKCPHCAKEMVTNYMGGESSTVHPERGYFSGTCPEGRKFVFYHKVGWVSAEEFLEQEGGDQPDAAPATEAEDKENPE